MCQAHTRGWVLARARVQVLQNSGSQMVVLRFTTLSARDCHWRSPRKKKLSRAHWQQYKKRACQCTDKLNRGRGFHYSSGIEPKSPDPLQPVLITMPLIRIIWLKKMVYDSSYFATCNWIFCVKDCRPRIFQLEYQGQTQNTRILERKPLIDTSYCIRHRLELKYFHFAQFLLNAHRAAHWPQKKWELIT